MTTGPFRSFTAAQRGVIAIPPTFASLSAMTWEFWIRRPAPLTNGAVIRIGSPTSDTVNKLRVRVGDLGRIILDRTIGTSSQVSQSAEGTNTAGVWQHVVAVFPNGANHRLYVNGEEVTLTHTGAALSGPLAITSTDQLTIGDPGPTALVGFVGDLGRPTLWPRAFTAAAAKVSYRHQSDPVRWMGKSAEDRQSDTDRSPVAVPMRVNATAGVAVTINPRTVGYDPDGTTLSLVAASASLISGSGSVTQSGGNIIYTPPASFSGEAVIGYTLRDAGTKRSTGRVYVTVAAATTPAVTDRFLNPFNYLSIHHRPLGSGIRFGIPRAVPLGSARTDANLTGGVEFTGSNEAAARGRLAEPALNLNLQQDVHTRKYMTRIEATDPIREIRHNTGISNRRMPVPGDGAYYPPDVTPPAEPGEGQIILYRRDGGTADIADTFHKFQYRVGEAFSTAGIFKSWPLSFIDQWEPGSPGDDGTSAVNRRWPGGLLRGHEVNGTDTTPIGHSFTATLTRTTPASAAQHLLGKATCFPAYGSDSNADTDTRNLGDIPYGACMTFTDEAYARIIAALPPSNVRGRKVIDAIYYYGMYADDGGGDPLEVSIRCDSEVGRTPTGATIPGVRTDIESALSLARNELWPIYNPDTYDNRVTLVGGLPFVGGGGPRNPLNRAASRNTAYDAPNGGLPPAA